MRRPPSVIIWDVGGTLVTRVMESREFLARALQGAGIRPDRVQPESARRAQDAYAQDQLRWRTPQEEREGWQRLAAMLLEGAGASAAQVERLANAWARYYEVYAPVPGIPELLDELAARGCRQAVVSNWPPSLREFLEHHRLSRHFDVIVGSGEEGVLKPDPALFQRALQRLQISPGDAIYVGNDPALDIVPARSLGIHAVHFDPRGQHAAADANDAGRLRELLRQVLSVDRPDDR